MVAGGGAYGLGTGPAGLHSAETSLSATPASCRFRSAAHSSGPRVDVWAIASEATEPRTIAATLTIFFVTALYTAAVLGRVQATPGWLYPARRAIRSASSLSSDCFRTRYVRM